MPQDILINGQQQSKLPAITVSFNPQTQHVGLQFDTDDFKTWDFVEATLNMAVSFVQDKKREAKAIAMQQAMAQAQHDAAIAKRVMTGK